MTGKERASSKQAYIVVRLVPRPALSVQLVLFMVTVAVRPNLACRMASAGGAHR